MYGDIEYSFFFLNQDKKGKGSIINLVKVIISESSTRSQP